MHTEKKNIKELKITMDKDLADFQKGFSSLHTAMMANLVTDVDGSSVSVREIATMTTPDARTIQIQPWEKSSIQPIEHLSTMED
jgi:ribosome recycling factor